MDRTPHPRPHLQSPSFHPVAGPREGGSPELLDQHAAPLPALSSLPSKGQGTQAGRGPSGEGEWELREGPWGRGRVLLTLENRVVTSLLARPQPDTRLL